MTEEHEDAWKDATPLDHAVAWLVGGFSHYIGQGTYNERTAFVRTKSGCQLEEAQKATSQAVKALGHEPHKFIPPFWPNFGPDDIDVGDMVYGGRIVYDEHVMMHGRVTRVVKWYAGNEPHYTVYIHGKFAGYEGQEDIPLGSIYKVEKKGE